MNSRLVAFLALSLGAATAKANIAAPHHYPAQLAGPRALAPTGIEVLDETLRFSCEGSRLAPRCAFEARYNFFNPSPREVATVAAFYGVRISELSIHAGARSLQRPLGAEEIARLDLAVKKAQASLRGGWAIHALSEGMGRYGFTLKLAAQSRQTVVVRGMMHPKRNFYPSYSMSAAQTRHSWLGSGEREAPQVDFRYFLAPIRSWARYPHTIAVSISCPEEWQLRSATKGFRHTTTTVGGQRRVEGQVDPNQAPELYWHAILPGQALHHGGLLLGIGGDVSAGGGLRLRLAYELAAPRWLFYGLALDTDFERLALLTPLVEVASQGLMAVIPSAGLGLGLPIRLAPERQVGLRAQITLQWPLLGFVTSFDVFPGFNASDPRFFAATLLFQLGF